MRVPKPPLLRRAPSPLLAPFLVLSRYRDKTNNAAERALRHAVIMHKVQLGTQSDQGSRWVERILSVRETLRLQDRPLLDYLIRAASAGHHGQPAPSPLPP